MTNNQTNEVQVDGHAIDYSGLPQPLREGMRRYIERRLETGDFLYDVLSNDLCGACQRADETNRHRLFEIVSWLYNNAPAGCWGSKDRVVRWLNRDALLP